MENKRRLIDISVVLSETTWAWPGDRPFGREIRSRVAKGPSGAPTGANTSVYTLSAHLGTHVDAPLHVGEGTIDVRQLPLDSLLGPCTVATPAKKALITAADLLALPVELQRVERLILHTGAGDGAQAAGHFAADYPVLDSAAAELLADSGVRLLGLDAPSVDPMGSETLPNHHVLLAQGLTILEGLCLATVPDGTYMLSALPLAIRGGDGSPVRAVLRSV